MGQSIVGQRRIVSISYERMVILELCMGMLVVYSLDLNRLENVIRYVPRKTSRMHRLYRGVVQSMWKAEEWEYEVTDGNPPLTGVISSLLPPHPPIQLSLAPFSKRPY